MTLRSPKGLLNLVLLLALALPLLFFSRALRADETRMDWVVVEALNAQGEIQLALEGTVPTDIADFEIVVTFDPETLALLSGETAAFEGLSSSFDTSIEGVAILRGEPAGGSIAAGSYRFGSLRFRLSGDADGSVTLARTTMRTPGERTVPGTTLLSFLIRAADRPAASESDTSASTSASAAASSSAESGTGPTPAASESATPPADTSPSSGASSAESSAASGEEAGAGLFRGKGLLIAACALLLVLFLIVLLLLLPKKKR